jgi:predicted O-linked N-acetylglucosamine transferase (SPINDLY family)
MNINEAIQSALKNYQAGNIQQAENLLKEILEAQSNNINAINLLGVLYYQQKDYDSAIKYTKKLINLNPSNAQAYYILGHSMQEKGEIDEAITHYQRSLQLNPNFADAHYNLGTIFQDKKRNDEAISCYQKALQLNPNDVDAYYNLGCVLQEKEEFDEAIACYQKALELNPNSAEAYTNLGVTLSKKRQLDGTISYYPKAMEHNPNFNAVYYYDLARALDNRGLFKDAIYYYKKSFEYLPISANLYFNLANALNKSRKFDEAISNYINAINLKPDFIEAYNNLGNTLHKQGKFDEAISYFEQALQHNPNFPEVYVSLGNILKDQGKINEAENCYKHASQINPNIVLPHEALLFVMNYNPCHHPENIFYEHVRFAKQFAEPLYNNIRPHTNERSPHRKLRIGYVSPDFKWHSVAYFIEPVLIAHQREHFEVFCYSDVIFPDEVTTRIRANIEHWSNILGMSDKCVAELINTDQIDILVDLAGHTDGNRSLLFARKPAPVQVSWIGYPATTGLSTVDYKIVDSYTDPLGMTEQFYSERLMRLPECFLCYLPAPDSPEIGSLPSTTLGHITFGSFNNFAKVSSFVLSLWVKILKAIPNSRLIMKAESLVDKTVCRNLSDLFIREGVDISRIELLSRVPLVKEHLNLYNRVDIGLDTFPYNGTTTTCEAIWMGVPVVTLFGKSHASRVGLSLLSNIGLPDLVAKTHDEYISITVNLAKDFKRLQSLREHLRDMIRYSPLCDAKRFTSNLEMCYRQIWEKWCKSD